MAVVSFPARNKLAYPAGSPPRFDPAHVAAARDCLISAVCVGGSLINLLGNSQATIVSTPSFSVDGQIGPGISCGNATTQAVTIAYPSRGTIPTNTFAAIGKLGVSTGSIFAYWITLHGADGSCGFAIDLAGNVLTFNAGSTAAVATGAPAIVVGVPYFIAFSNNTTTINWIIKRLDTGQVYSGVETGTYPAFTPSGAAYLNNRASTRSNSGPLAAAMSSLAFLSPSQLRAWADDPWAFWYPSQARSRVAAAAAADDYAAFYTPQHGGGATTQMIGI